MSAALNAIGRVIARLVASVARRPVATVVLVLGLAGAGGWYAAGHLGINTDTANMISPDLPWRQDFIAYRDGFPLRDQNIVAVIEAADGSSSLAYAERLAAELRTEPALFPTVFLAGDGEFFERNGLLYLPLDQLETLADRLIEAQPLLGRLAGDPSGSGLLATLTLAIERSGESAGAGADEIERLLGEIAASLAAANAGSRRAIAWGGLLGAESQTSNRQLILIRPALDFSRVRPARDAIERIRDVHARLSAAAAADGAGDVSLALTGALAMEHEELSSITRSASLAGIAALATVILVLLGALRSLKLLAVSIVTLFAGLGLTAAFAALVVGHLNLLSVAFAVLYVGLGVDFILHLILRMKELSRAGLAVDAALIDTAQGVGSSLLVCAVTTAVGFFAFIPTDFDGISELGLISGGGMFISLAVSLTLLPALLKLCWGSRDADEAAARPRWRFRVELPARATCGVAGVVVVLALLLLPALEFDGNPIHLRDPDAESIRALESLANDSAAPLFNLAILVPNAEAAASLAGQLAMLDPVERVLTVDSLVPAEQADKLFVLEDLELVLGSTLAEFAEVGVRPAGERLPGALEGLLDALDGQAGSSAAASALATEARAWLAREASDAAADVRAAALDRDLAGDLVDQIARLRHGLTASTFGRADLPAELSERWVNAAGQELVEVVPRENLNDNEAAGRFVAAVRGLAPNATGLPVVYQEAGATVARAFILALAYAFIAVTLMLLVFLRSLRDTVLVLVPIGFAAIVTAALSVLFGLPLNFANIIALPLLVGVGVDSGIHMVHRMRTEPPRDGDPLRTSTSRAVFASALTTIASFGNLAFSSHVGMASMGQLLTLGMLTSLVAVLGLLPALMRLGERR